MLTLFSIPKACEGHIGIIQRNAFESWKQLGNDIQIIILGRDPGVAEAAEEFGFEYLAAIECNSSGTPLIPSMFLAAQKRARYSRLCYVNADIILFSDFIDTIRKINFQRFLLVGQRWNLDIQSALSFDSGWHLDLRSRIEREGDLAGKYAIDYFVFSKGLFGAIPPFAIGRYYWDNWLLFRARNRKSPIIDASESILALHQNHGYGQNETMTAAELRKTPEVQRNRCLSGGYSNGLDLHQADWTFRDNKLVQRTINDMGWRNWLISRLACYPGFYKFYDQGIHKLEKTMPETIKKRIRPYVLRDPSP